MCSPAVHGGWMVREPRVLSSQPLREGWPPITEEEVELPSGARKNWIRMHFGISAAVLAVTKRKEIVLTREYRHGLGRVTFSLPGGTAKDGESAEACARRELLEETGYQAPRLLEMYTGNNLTAYLEGTLHLFFGRDCQPTERRPDPDEIQAGEGTRGRAALSRARAGECESAVGALRIVMAHEDRRRPARGLRDRPEDDAREDRGGTAQHHHHPQQGTVRRTPEPRVEPDVPRLPRK